MEWLISKEFRSADLEFADDLVFFAEMPILVQVFALSNKSGTQGLEEEGSGICYQTVQVEQVCFVENLVYLWSVT